MKNKITNLAIALMAFTLVSACKKKDTGNSSIYLSANYVPANGSSIALGYNSSEITSKKVTGYYSIDAIDGDGREVTLVMNDYTGVGTYLLDTAGTRASAVVTTDQINFKKAVYGTITITNTSLYLIGTFSFTCIDSTKVSGGKFQVLPL